MQKTLKHRIFRNLLFAVLCGVIYSLSSFIDKGYVEIDMILGATVAYFLILCLLSFIAPKLRKITGHDKDNS